MGVEVGFNREHCLIYSSCNNEYFVAVQDENAGTIVTVLTSAYHKTLSWRLKRQYEAIDEEVLRKVKLLAIHKVHSDELALNIGLKARYLDCDGKIKTTTIKKYKASAYSFQPSQLIAKEQKVNNLVSRWLRRVFIDEIIDVYSTMGRSRPPCFAPKELVEKLNEKVNRSHAKRFTQYFIDA